LLQKLPGRSDERTALLIFVPPRCLTYEQQISIFSPFTGYRLGTLPC